MRIGHGYDVHRLVEGRDLILGGVKIPYELGLLGHSDADVLLHAYRNGIVGCTSRNFNIKRIISGIILIFFVTRIIIPRRSR